jgi:pimeloyl-ACP methyl ester carboxylesterase
MRAVLRGLAIALLAVSLAEPLQAGAGNSAAEEGFVAVNGVRLQYLDWGGSGPALILIHGLGDDPHCFDDLAPALTDRFRVIAYARRSAGSSEVKGPYDTVTLTEDLRGLMDALGIARAHLAGHSAGGNEVTAMAGRYPDRVGRLVYLDSGYDFADPQSVAAFAARPVFTRPAEAAASFDAFRAHELATLYPQLDDGRRIESYLRKKVVVHPDGSIEDRVSKAVRDELYAALFSSRRDYTRVRSPVLAIYPEHWYPPEVADPERRKAVVAYDAVWAPFKAASIERLRREIRDVRIATVPGAHSNFMLMSRASVVATLRDFLDAPIQHRDP